MSTDPRLLWVAGRDRDDLLARLDDVDALARGVVPDGEGPARLGIVDPDERKLRLARRLLDEGAPWRGRSDIWFSPAGLVAAGGKVAFLFPGVEPTFGVGSMDLPALAARFQLEPPQVHDDTVAHRSASIYRVGIFLDRVLRAMGVTPDLVAGHSIGEWCGSVAAGIVPIRHADDLVGAVDLSAVKLPDLDFAAFAGGAEVVGAAIDDLDDIVLSHDNAPNQSIVCGRPPVVEVAVERLRAQGVLGYTLGFQSGFHTPAMADSLPTFRRHLEQLEVGPGDVPMWSATTVDRYPADPAAIIDLHLRHLTEPVRFRPLIDRLHGDAGARVFLQVGVGSLTAFVGDILGDREHATVPLLSPRRSALAQAHRALTALWVEGVDVRPDALRPPAARAVTSNGSPAAGSTNGHGSPPARSAPAAGVPGGGRDGSAPADAGAATVGSPATRQVATIALGGPVTAAGSTALLGAADMLTAAALAGQSVLDALSARLAGAAPAAVPPPAAAGSATRSAVTVPTAPPAGTAAPAPDTTAAGPVPSGDGTAPAPTGPPPHGGDGALPAWAPAPPQPWPSGTVVVRRRLSLETMPETIDHTLYTAPDGWPDVSDRFPIVAMTTQLQLVEDVAASFAGGRDVLELFGVRNYRWLDIAEPLDLEITVTPKGDDVLAIALGPYCRANVRVGTLPAARPRHEPAALTNPRPTTHTAREMFDLRLMFHGPRFQGVTALGPVGDDGMQGTFDSLDTPGSLLDDLGKLIAYWAIDHGGIGEAALPSGVARVELFGPKPGPGTDVHCDIRVTDLQRDLIRADGVLVLPDGTLLARVEGWTSILFHLDELMEPLHHDPGHSDVAEAQPGGWYVVRERWPTGPARDLTARRYLDRADRERYAQLNLLEQRRWLLEVIAAKDAVRHWLRDTFGLPCFPVEVGLVPDGDRRFRVECARVPAGHDPHVTLSVIGWVAVAVLGDGAHRDVEAVLVDDHGGDPRGAAGAAAAAVAERNPGAEVHRVERPPVDIPSRLEVPDPPPFAVAWT